MDVIASCVNCLSSLAARMPVKVAAVCCGVERVQVFKVNVMFIHIVALLLPSGLVQSTSHRFPSLLLYSFEQLGTVCKVKKKKISNVFTPLWVEYGC